MTRVKVCGVTSVSDALMCVDAGVDAIGLNFWEGSARRCDEAVAREIADAVSAHVLVVGVFVNASQDTVSLISEAVGLGSVQLHGNESPEMLARFLPNAYKALRVRGPETLEEMRRYPGDHVLLDAYVKGVPGGTGETFDWSLARLAAAERKVTLAGGLTPKNVADAVWRVAPYCVDTAGGVESAPGVKNEALVRAFVQRAKDAVRGA